MINHESSPNAWRDISWISGLRFSMQKAAACCCLTWRHSKLPDSSELIQRHRKSALSLIFLAALIYNCKWVISLWLKRAVCIWFQVRYPADYFYPILLFFAQLHYFLSYLTLQTLVFCKDAIFLTLRVVKDYSEQLLEGFMVWVGNIIAGNKCDIRTSQGF